MPLEGIGTLTVLLGAVMMQRVGHTGRLLQDLVGAVIFLIAIIAAMAYVLDLPVKGVLATSGAVAIIVGLALQSTLSDVFSGIVLNTTKPYHAFVEQHGAEHRKDHQPRRQLPIGEIGRDQTPYGNIDQHQRQGTEHRVIGDK